jgi:hypothetical protein
MKTIDFGKDLKELYTAGKEVREVTAAAGAFFAVDGQGAPGGEAFQKAIEQLYATLFTAKFALKQQGTIDFKVNKLEGLYFSEPHQTPMDQWQWRLMVRVPDEVGAKELAAARKVIQQRKGLDTKAVRRIRWKEGRAVQVMHVGPYDQVEATYRRLLEYAQQHELALAGAAHEIYLSDPRRVAPERLKTIVRLPVKRA